ncbi:4Fe-4S dicluster domain-containing protein [Candidatus Bathyarchaeota archaeon]|nr:4Fe-4S dicluster domain-containing protein [Candidatus Bathyarchaeota archaeon]
MKALVAWSAKCSGCRICELVCSVAHFKVNNPKKSAIRVMQLFPKPAVNTPIFCRQCAILKCAEKCPTKAITRSPDGRMVVDQTNCIGCGACAEGCPFGAIYFHPEVKTPIKCDLCDGNPRCVQFCPTNALEYVPKSVIAQSTRTAIAGKHRERNV